mmetsp:Transcript_104396/g.302007  ORF Transcript_104396/g.302007 Transcript_104396/m.302007 type:complete len:307 (+) Transcript_104396:606-1526(+)
MHPQPAHQAASVVDAGLNPIHEKHQQLSYGPEQAVFQSGQPLELLDVIHGLADRGAFELAGVRNRRRVPRPLSRLFHSLELLRYVVVASQRLDALSQQILGRKNVQQVQARDEAEHHIRGKHRRDHRRNDKPHDESMEAREAVKLVEAWIVHLGQVERAGKREARENIGDHRTLHNQHNPTADAQEGVEPGPPLLVRLRLREQLVASGGLHEPAPQEPTLPRREMHIGCERIRRKIMIRNFLEGEVQRASQAANPKAHVKHDVVDFLPPGALEDAKPSQKEDDLQGHRPLLQNVECGRRGLRVLDN